MKLKSKISRYLSVILILSLMAFTTSESGIYSFTVKDIDGKDFNMASLKGKKIMIVNVASKCGYTPQYEELQALYLKYGGENFEIIGFPANDFLKQEPGTNAEIKQFCTSTYEVTFPMMAKISVKGNEIAPIYKWLTEKSQNGVEDSKVKWNFQKYLIDEKGKLVEVLSSGTKPNDEKIIAWLEEK